MKNPKLSLIDIEIHASNSEATPEQYKLMLWHTFIVKRKENASTIKCIARYLNIYPTAANVYYAVLDELFSHVQLA